MFIGHFGAGFAAKIIDKKMSLGTLFMASQFIDLLWPLFLLLGIEHVEIDPGNTAFTPLDFIYYPFSHSLLAVAFWGIIFGLTYYFIRKNLKGSILLGLLVLSHWVLDLITHRPDLPLFPGSETNAGLELWNSVILTIIFEGLIFAGGIYLYVKATSANKLKGKLILWFFAAFMMIVYFMNIIGPPPPSEEAIAYAGLSMWLLVAWGYWIDRNRKTS